MATMSPKKAAQNNPVQTDADAIADSILKRQREYLDPKLTKIEQVGKDNDVKLTAIQTELTTLAASLIAIKSDVESLKTAVKSNSHKLNEHSKALQAMEFKLADMEDRSRRCNVRVTGLDEGIEGSNATQFLLHSLPKWFPTLDVAQIEIVSAHRIYNANGRNRGTNRTLIFNVLRYSSRQAILRAARKDPLAINGRNIRFSPDYSNFTVKRRQGFQQAMSTARAKGLDFFLLYPATLKIKDGAQLKTFTSAKEAEDFLASVPAPRPEDPVQDDSESRP